MDLSKWNNNFLPTRSFLAGGFGYAHSYPATEWQGDSEIENMNIRLKSLTQKGLGFLLK